ncbi:hypothetical protein KQI61_15385 [Anaerocolumna aminovalerica]|uniref:hypothetical protein n=1 Tax=Anaerocolumna aminovalerica TaxID=1527 RepID=UPI001C0F2B49|nr:hypothetical protein [Anaerocolumna aminovalerica]MBU5333581.1 hypothetical protein [Anaerocolumna aminovalerica]
MFVESIKFQREQGSEWERGYYIGDTDNSNKSTILDANYKPVLERLWDYHTDTDNWVQLRCNENDVI